MQNTISFTKVIKEELSSNIYESIDRLKALLSAYIRINGSLVFHQKSSSLLLKTENAKIAKFIYKSLEDIYHSDAHFEYLQKGNMKKTIYSIVLDNNVDNILKDLEVSFLEGKISKNVVYNDDTISGYLAGAFLAAGSCNSPHNSNYHLEISTNSENYSKWLSKLFGKYKNSNIEPKVIKRREKYVIYFKRSDQIADFLIMIGAVSSCMEFENVRIDRDFNNSTNRLTNSDLANMKKTYETGKRQCEEIKAIDEKLGIKNISNVKERELCLLRLENVSASLLDLADMLSEKLGTHITKSNINHLFRSIHEKYVRLLG